MDSRELQANELMIGNWVDYLGAPITVEGIRSEAHPNRIETRSGFPVPLEHIQSIPLSPEILEAAGFIFNPDYNFFDASVGERWVNGKYIIGEVEEFYILSWSSNINTYHYDYAPRNLQYLHQLQNLYFALTGKPLQISLTKLTQ